MAIANQPILLCLYMPILPMLGSLIGYVGSNLRPPLPRHPKIRGGATVNVAHRLISSVALQGKAYIEMFAN